ncbi:pyridoxamine 5'-phosphate oxidase family protein [Microbacterium oleivorans]|uniref:pyridoxamine 5'-phosphate oxidase family protein n=1 Tax=Microbacterium oleivorans TaxID=273677 RepID=UPI000975A743
MVDTPSGLDRSSDSLGSRGRSRGTGRGSRDKVLRLTTAQCWSLVEGSSVGRLAVIGVDGMPDIFPVNYAVHGGSVYIRSAPGSKLLATTVHPVGAFEIDGEDSTSHWSVVLRGAAESVETDSEIRAAGIRTLVSLSPTAKYDYLRVTPVSIAGRRFAKRVVTRDAAQSEIPKVPAAGSEPASPENPSETRRRGASRARQPVSIAHYPPL